MLFLPPVRLLSDVPDARNDDVPSARGAGFKPPPVPEFRLRMHRVVGDNVSDGTQGGEGHGLQRLPVERVLRRVGVVFVEGRDGTDWT